MYYYGAVVENSSFMGAIQPQFDLKRPRCTMLNHSDHVVSPHQEKNQLSSNLIHQQSN